MRAFKSETILTTPEILAFANALSDVVHDALEAGMAPELMLCVGAGVLADYALDEIGPDYPAQLAQVIQGRVKIQRRGRQLQ